MSFRFYIVSSFNGEVSGTDDEELARYWAESQDDFVIDTKRNLWLASYRDDDTPITENKYIPEGTEETSEGVSELPTGDSSDAGTEAV